MALDPLPALDRTSATFKADLDAYFLTALPAFSGQANALQTDVNAKQVTASAAAVTAAADAATATAAAATAVATANATRWVSGTTYALDVCVISPVNSQTYRRKVAGAGTTDPSLDATNWARAVDALPVQTGNAGKFLTTNGTAESWGAVPAQALVLLATLTPTAAANVDFLTTFSGTYDNYLIVGSGLTPSGIDALRFQLAVAGVADTATNYYTAVAMSTTATATAVANGTITTNIGASGKGAHFNLSISNVNSSGAKFGLAHSVGENNNANNFAQALYGVVYTPASVVTGIRLFWNSGSNFAATGKIRVYGYANT